MVKKIFKLPGNEVHCLVKMSQLTVLKHLPIFIGFLMLNVILTVATTGKEKFPFNPIKNKVFKD